MASDHIGQWTGRFSPNAHESATVPVGNTKWHKIESDIADRKVVKCGKELRDKTPSGELRFKDAPPVIFDTCQPCSK
jgi:hypothetical protein